MSISVNGDVNTIREENGMDESIFNNGNSLPDNNIPQQVSKEKTSKKRKAQEPTAEPPIVNYTHPYPNRLVNALHIPQSFSKNLVDLITSKIKDTRMKCTFCTAKTTIRCTCCNIALCISNRDHVNCFKEYHSEPQFNNQDNCAHKHFPISVPKNTVDENTKKIKDTRAKCGICTAKTTIRCSTCNVGLCISNKDGVNCWKEFHTVEVLDT